MADPQKVEVRGSAIGGVDAAIFAAVVIFAGSWVGDAIEDAGERIAVAIESTATECAATEVTP